MILIIISMGIITSFVQYYRSVKVNRENYKITGFSILRNCEQHLAHHIYLHEVVDLQKVIERIKAEEQDVVYIFLLNQKNEVTANTFEQNIPVGLLEFNNKPIANIEIIKYGGKVVYDFSYPIENGSLGIIRLGLSGEKFAKDIKSQVLFEVILFLVFIIIGIIISVFTSNKLTNFITKLLDSVHKIADGDFDARIQIKTNDEIGELATSINYMANNLHDLKESLEEKISTLETKNTEIELINKELSEAKEKAEESDRLKTEFLNNMSHEVRTPMNAIVGFSNLLLDANMTNEQKSRFISIINNSSNELLDIISNIIDISKINIDNIDVHYQEIDLTDLLRNIYNKYLSNAQSKNVDLNFKMPEQDTITAVFCDMSKLVRIMDCLINNAIKFTNEGEVLFGFNIANNLLEFFVKDTGIGIDNKDKDLIFERFRKIGKNNEIIYRGNGLGLSITKAFVQALNGEIWFESEVNKGTTFYFTIPLQGNKQLENTIINKSIKKDHVILIVEDEITNFLYLEELLNGLKVKILHAKNGKEAQQLFEENEIDLVLMDIKLPDTDGLKLTQEFKRKSPNIPIIAQTAYAMEGDRQKALNAGCNDYISKPINYNSFQLTIGKFININ